MNDKPNKKIKTLPIIKRFCLSIGQLPTSYLESMSYMEQVTWLCNYLENVVIPALNQNGEAVEELQNLFVLLKEYVDNYLDNINITEDVSNKIDELVQNGTMTQLIETYINPYIENQNLEIEAFKTEVNNNISLLENEIQSATSGSPLVASSVAGMTDTSRIYVNTTDGYWYYYNGAEWTQGGVYQASQPSDELATIEKYIPKLVKFVNPASRSTLINITIDSTSLVINRTANEIIRLSDETHFKRWLTNAADTFTFLRADYNYGAGVWAIVFDGTGFSLVQLTENAPSINKDDLILGIISNLGNDLICVSNGVKVNNAYTGGYNNYNAEVINIRFGTLKITADNTSIKTEVINPSGSQLSLSSNIENWYANNTEFNKTFNKTDYAYNNGVWLLVANHFGTLDLIQLPTKSNIRDYLHYSNTNSVIGYFIENATKFYTSCQNGIEFNGKIMGTADKIESIENSLGYINKYDFMRCFKTFTGIGDSLMAGYTSVDGHTINSATARTQENNWFSYLVNRLNRTGTNLAIGSSTAHNWRYHDQSGGLDSNIENANIPTNCYFMGIGVNDERQSLPVGYETDIQTDYTQNSDSFYGNYDYCINRLKIFNPHAKIFCFTIPNSEENANNYNTAIRYVCSLYDNVYCIDLNNLYDFSVGFIADNFTNGHYNPITYNYISILIEKAINDYIFNNHTEFDLVPYNFD